MTTDVKKIHVLFVCLGNICRSPSAQGIFQHYVDEAGLTDVFVIDSCGTAAFNVGKAPDLRAINATKHFGYDIKNQIARQIRPDDFHLFDYIIPMDRKNLMNISAWTPQTFAGEIKLFMQYHPNNMGENQIPDPYHDKPENFYPIIKVIEEASQGLLTQIRQKYAI